MSTVKSLKRGVTNEQVLAAIKAGEISVDRGVEMLALMPSKRSWGDKRGRKGAVDKVDALIVRWNETQDEKVLAELLLAYKSKQPRVYRVGDEGDVGRKDSPRLPARRYGYKQHSCTVSKDVVESYTAWLSDYSGHEDDPR
jgi:hypothetical protein